MIPVFALLIPLAAIAGSMVLKIQKVKLEEARLHAADPTVLAEVDDLRQELQQVRGELAEMQERLDFTERMLTSRTGGPKENA
ncbi:MAG TPA: hypothetical protein VJU15_10210 [Gemmatimonadales bacterium]|nr:hypothetical protein [Gemmatimonadales bacterium]